MVLFYNELSVSVYNANDVVSCSMSRSELLRAFVYFWSLGILIFFLCVLFGAMELVPCWMLHIMVEISGDSFDREFSPFLLFSFSLLFFFFFCFLF